MDKILGLLLTVSNIEKMCTFFTEVLSFEQVGICHLEGAEFESLSGIPGAKGDLAILKLGQEHLYLLAFDPPGKPYPQTRSNDHLFQHIAIVVSDLERAHQLLSKHGIVPISEGPVTIPEWNEAAAGIKAFYFRSPEGHPLELIYFPPKKGRTLWQEKGRLFLGIDHTALTVFHTEKSLPFYRGVLGMEVMGESLNHGSTQESLTGVAGAKVQITGLGFKGIEGMGLEFLHYLIPDGGKPTPDLKANDLGSTYTVIEVESLEQWRHLQLSHGQFAPHDPKVLQSAICARDPDGHLLLLVTLSP